MRWIAGGSRPTASERTVAISISASSRVSAARPARFARCAASSALRLRQEGPAGGREPCPARQALEQRAPHLELEQPDLLRDRRRGDVQVVGRGTERSALGDRDQVFELPEIHGALEQ
jgi:hypothetical protein